MNSCAKDIATLINDESSIGLVLGTDLFYSRMPVTPQNCVVLYDNSGPTPMLQLSQARSTYNYNSISVRVRNTSYDGAYAIIDAIQTFLHGRHGDVINNTYYALVRAITPPQQLHFDENDRPVININFEVQRRPN